ncbi:hypothetical protein [Lacibacter sediminis]|uniref:Lipoprotein n=1 Tax=Lacibacter sediminis TaxID=2760713 RepID=A0A7G5XJ12_9BACT|nr:hypothetical protein [Lacibacter sediminis]QNA45465.1 hypothetical protein H4075_04485 [Lacibacter sediminis]
MKPLSFILFLSLLLGSCSYPCGNSSGLHLNFVSYTKAEIHGFSISRYEKGSNFNNLISSNSFDSSIVGLRQSGDTIRYAYFSNDALLPSGFDYKVFIPSTNITYNITDLREPQETGIKNGQKVYCMNQIVSCKVNGNTVTISNEDLFLKK